MRSDMIKVLVERPRRRNRGPYGSERIRDLEEAPLREPMSMGRGSKEFTDNLRPLRRFLESRCGRQWNDVYSEICEHLRPSGTLHAHLLQHLSWMVDLTGDASFRDFFVCPRTGQLKVGYRWRHGYRGTPPPPREVIPLGENREARLMDGFWYEIVFAPWPSSFEAAWDQLLHVSLREQSGRDRVRRSYGSEIWACSKRRMSNAEAALLKP